MTNTVNERSPLRMTVSFTDEDGFATTPTSVDWRLENKDAGTEIVAWTAATPVASSMNINILGTKHVIADEDNIREAFVFSIRVDSGLSTEGYAEYHYHVINLEEPETP